MEMTKEEFKLLHLRPALYDNTIMTVNIVFDDKALWRAEAKVALSLGLQPGDAAEYLVKLLILAERIINIVTRHFI